MMVILSMLENMLSRHRGFKALVPELGVDLMKLSFRDTQEFIELFKIKA